MNLDFSNNALELKFCQLDSFHRLKYWSAYNMLIDLNSLKGGPIYIEEYLGNPTNNIVSMVIISKMNSLYP
jgi:hypothetical protein